MPQRVSSHSAQINGVKTCPTLTSSECKVFIAIFPEVFQCCDATHRVPTDPLIVLNGEINEHIIELVSFAIPCDLIPDLVYSVVKTELTCPEILNPVGILWQHDKGCDSDVLNIAVSTTIR